MNRIMAKKQLGYLRSCVVRATRVHFALVFVLASSIVIFDGWNYITLENALNRWMIVAALLVVNTVVWYASRNLGKKSGYYKALMLGLIVSDIAVAAMFVYNDRGIASPAVMLYAIPIATSAVLYSRRALFATAALCTAAYNLTVVSYFVLNFNEAITVQLYGTAALYSAVFFVIAALLWVVITPYEQTD